MIRNRKRALEVRSWYLFDRLTFKSMGVTIVALQIIKECLSASSNGNIEYLVELAELGWRLDEVNEVNTVCFSVLISIPSLST